MRGMKKRYCYDSPQSVCCPDKDLARTFPIKWGCDVLFRFYMNCLGCCLVAATKKCIYLKGLVFGTNAWHRKWAKLLIRYCLSCLHFIFSNFYHFFLTFVLIMFVKWFLQGLFCLCPCQDFNSDSKLKYTAKHQRESNPLRWELAKSH